MKMYLGDGAYVDFNGRDFILTTENGVAVTNTVVLGPDEWSTLKRYEREIAEMMSHD